MWQNMVVVIEAAIRMGISEPGTAMLATCAVFRKWLWFVVVCRGSRTLIYGIKCKMQIGGLLLPIRRKIGR